MILLGTSTLCRTNLPQWIARQNRTDLIDAKWMTPSRVRVNKGSHGFMTNVLQTLWYVRSVFLVLHCVQELDPFRRPRASGLLVFDCGQIATPPPSAPEGTFENSASSTKPQETLSS